MEEDEAEVNCYADENMNLLALLGLAEQPKKRAKKEPTVRTPRPLRLCWRREPLLRIEPQDVMVENGIATLRRVPNTAAQAKWVLARLKGYASGGEVDWMIRVVPDDGGDYPACAVGVEDEKGALSLLDLRTGVTQNDSNRQEQLFDKMPVDNPGASVREMLIRVRLSFSTKKLLISVNNGAEKPAFRLTTGASYTPVIAFATVGVVQILEVNIRT